MYASVLEKKTTNRAAVVASFTVLLLERLEQSRRLADARKGDAKGLHFEINVLGFHNFVP